MLSSSTGSAVLGVQYVRTVANRLMHGIDQTCTPYLSSMLPHFILCILLDSTYYHLK